MPLLYQFKNIIFQKKYYKVNILFIIKFKVMPIFYIKKKIFIYFLFSSTFLFISDYIKKTLYNIEKNFISVRSFLAENGKMWETDFMCNLYKL